MTIAKEQNEYLKRTKYRCDICGKMDYWSDGWSSYGSMAHEDTCPMDVIHTCSVECFKKLENSILHKKISLPTLKCDGNYHMIVVKGRVGY